MSKYRYALVAALFLTLPAMSMAATITSATVYLNVPDPGNAGDLANNTASTLPSANFSIGAAGINFVSDGSYTVNPFLNNPTYTNIHNGFSGTSLIGSGSTGLELVITGIVTLTAGNNTFTVGHDDGAVLSFGGGIGTVLNAPGPSGYTLTPVTFSAPSAGNYTFTLDYAECCGPPADLNFQVNSVVVNGSTPEPSSLVLLGTGIIAAAGAVRRRLTAR